MSLDSLMTHLVTLERATNATDTSGGTTKTWAAVESASPISCSIQPISAKERMLWAQRNVVLTHYVYIPYATPVRRDDRLLIVDSNPARYLLIVSTPMDMAGRSEAWKCECREYVD